VSSPMEILLVVALVGYMLIRRLMGEPAQAKRMLVLPAVLTVIGLSGVNDILRDPVQLGFLAVTTLISIAVGALRGLSIRVFVRDGIVNMRYTGITIVLWVVNIAAKLGGNVLLGAVDPHAAAGNTLMLTLGAGLLMEGVIVLGKAMRTGGQVVWQQGKDGAPHRTSQWVDDLQARIADRGRR
jgi:hypothetical protein